MLELYRGVVGSRELHVVATERIDGDQRPHPGGVRRDWVMAAEEHGVQVLDADARPEADSDAGLASGGDRPLPPGDVLVTARTDLALAIWAGDCAPLVLCGSNGTLVAVHAGWRGLAGGVIDVAFAEFDARHDRVERAVLGPCIHAECYEFGDSELGQVAAGVGASVDEIRSVRPDASAALDVPRAVEIAVGRRGVVLDVTGPCTSCDDRWFSHRARAEYERHAVVAWTTAA